MRRFSMSILAIGLVASLLLTGCQKKVEVRTGTVVKCSYGHVIFDDVRTIEVPIDKAGSYRVKTVTKVCDLHKKLEKLYGQAQAAIVAGDIPNARKLLEQVVAIDRTYKSAREQLETVVKGGKPQPDTGSGASQNSTDSPGGGTATDPGTTPLPGTGSDTPAVKLLDWAPDPIAGYTAGKPAIDAFVVTRDYLPPSTSNVLTMVIVAEQFRDPKSAQAALETTVKQRYTRDITTPTINGRKGYSATDGRRYAIYGFTEGSVMVAVEATTRSGSPVALVPVVQEVARQLP